MVSQLSKDYPSGLDDRPTPRFGILHIILLTAAFGLLLMPARAIMQSGDDGIGSQFRRLFAAQRLSSAVLLAVPLASLPAWWVCRRRDERFPVEPGHFLLLLSGATALAGVAMRVFWLLIDSQNWNENSGTIVNVMRPTETAMSG